MKTQTKIAKLQMHENLHKNVNENMFSFTFFIQFFLSILRMAIEAASYIHWSLISLKLKSSSFRLHQVVPTLMVLLMLFPKFNRTLPLASERYENTRNILCFFEKFFQDNPHAECQTFGSRSGLTWSWSGLRVIVKIILR